ncbi:MAG: hypothetical protein QME64_05575 [bacterium]|nr:hypothetical protein [bacterium]
MITQIKNIISLLIILFSLFPLGYTLSADTTQAVNTTVPPPAPPPVPIIAPQRMDLPGQHFALSTGVVYIPPYFHPQGKKVNLLIHFHGASWMVEQNFYYACKNAVVVTIPLRGLSGVYTAKYKNKKEFGRLLKEIMETLDRENIVKKPRLGRLCLTSFSAGFGALREILQVPEYYRKITDTIFFDSIHSGLDTTTQTVPPDQMQFFLRFAQDAARGKKTMWVTHSEIDPITYASTTKTADYLISGVSAARMYLNQNQKGEGTSPLLQNQTGEDTSPLLQNEPWKSMRLLSTADKGKFHVRGFTGNTGQDHMNHFYTMMEFISKTSLPDILEK